MTTLRVWMVGLLLGLVAGCGSSGGASPGGGGAGSGAAGKGGAASGCQAMSWDDDGTSMCADFLQLTRSTKSGFDQLVAVGTKTTNVGLTFKVVVPGGGAIELGKDYACDGMYVVLVYQVGNLMSHTTTSCTINISALGSATTPAIGTFSAMLKAGDGTPKQITNGTFSAVPKISN
jgi:hypothetical protein